ncbi:MAG: transposase [Planctomycetaceae bacterium]|nr:transposase [Planctomycetales bacterium]MCB9923810.1 transposase [Planctomycetaceae bacterium]
MANCFRMFLHCLANNLLVSLRQTIANPPVEVASSNYLDPHEVPVEAQAGRARRHRFNRRRQADPLGEGHACTWRLRLIKVAARIKVTARRVRVFLSGSWPYLHHFHAVIRTLLPDT